MQQIFLSIVAACKLRLSMSPSYESLEKNLSLRRLFEPLKNRYLSTASKAIKTIGISIIHEHNSAEKA